MTCTVQKTSLDRVYVVVHVVLVVLVVLEVLQVLAVLVILEASHRESVTSCVAVHYTNTALHGCFVSSGRGLVTTHLQRECLSELELREEL